MSNCLSCDNILSTVCPNRCIKCGAEIYYGGTWIGGSGPYCHMCLSLKQNYYRDSDKGWECPRCKKVNSPDVKQCDCEPHSWEFIGSFFK